MIIVNHRISLNVLNTLNDLTMIIGGAALQPSGFGRRHEIPNGPRLDRSGAGLDPQDYCCFVDPNY